MQTNFLDVLHKMEKEITQIERYEKRGKKIYAFVSFSYSHITSSDKCTYDYVYVCACASNFIHAITHCLYSFLWL